MNFEGTRVLLLEGYARQALPLLKAFKDLGCRTAALCSSKLDVAYVSRFADVKFIGVCNPSDAEGTTKQIRALLRTGSFDLVVPTVDFSAGILSKNKKEFEEYCKVAVCDWETYEIAGDKLKTMRVCMQNQIPCPYTLADVESIDDILSSPVQYPIVVKPRTGYGAIGFKKIESPGSLTRLFGANGAAVRDYVFQEYIPQTDLQYECAMFVDSNNEVKTALVFSKNRWFPVSGGSSTLNITVERPDIVESCTQLLKTINWRGAADIDLIQDPRDGVAKIMEINPRVSGSVKICFISGVDLARQMLELAYGQPVTKYDKYRSGQRLRCSQTDFLWFLKSKNRFSSKPSWFSIKDTKDHTFSWDDPLPWFAFLFRGMKNLSVELKKRS
jgi:D-aspartate ligase